MGIYLGTRSTDSRPEVEFVLGGGTAATGAGPQVKVPGTLLSMTADRQGAVALFVKDAQGYKLWLASPGESARSVRLPDLDRFPTDETEVSQAATAPDGTFYIALGYKGLWHVTKDGGATRTIDTTQKDALYPSDAARPSGWSVGGVAVADDGTVYFTDVQVGQGTTLVGKLKSGVVTKVAGLAMGGDQRPRAMDPNSLSVKTGGPADSTFIPVHFNTGPLAWNQNALYLHTGAGILRIEKGRIFPVVGRRDTDELKTPRKPFEPFGKAINGYVGAPASGRDDKHASSIAADPTSGDVYYGAGEPTDHVRKPGAGADFGARFDWSGDFSEAQENFIRGGGSNQLVYQVNETQDLAAVTFRGKALAAAGGYLYLATDSCSSSSGARCASADSSVAVVRLLLPTS